MTIKWEIDFIFDLNSLVVFVLSFVSLSQANHVDVIRYLEFESVGFSEV